MKALKLQTTEPLQRIFFKHQHFIRLLSDNRGFVGSLLMHEPTKVCLIYLYRDCDMVLLDYLPRAYWNEARIMISLRSVHYLVMSASILELKDFVQYLSQLIG